MTDRNLFYQTRRSQLIEPLKPGLAISSVYKRDGVFNNEASVQGYGYIREKKDKNIFFQRIKKRQPILHKRIFKDLDPQSRALGSLDLTKEQRRAGAVLEGIEATRKLLDDFIKTPKLNVDGSQVIGIDGKPEFVHRSLTEVLKVSQEALFEQLKNNNVVPSENLTRIIFSFTHIEISQILMKMKAIIENDPAITNNAKRIQFKGAVLTKRLEDMAPVDNRVLNDAIGQEATDQNIIENDWTHAIYAVIFPFRGVTMAQYDNYSNRDKMTLNSYISARENSTGNQFQTVNGAPALQRMVGLFFSMGHVFDLQTLHFEQFAGSGAIRAQAHP